MWGLAYAYRALYHTILERESFRSEIQAQVNSDQSQEASVAISVAPVEGKKWKRVSMRLERKEGEAQGGAAEDPGAGHGAVPKKAKAKTKRHEEETDDEEEITYCRPLKLTEIQGSRKEFTRRQDEGILAWLLRCWDNGANSLSLDGNEARQLGSIAQDAGIDRGISRCSDGAATLWLRLLEAVRERYPYKDALKPKFDSWNTVQKGIQRLRELAMAKMLYSPDPSELDPERVRADPDMWQKITSTAPERMAQSLVTGSKGFVDRWPRVVELIIMLQTTDQQLPQLHAAVSAISRLENRVDEMCKKLFPSTNCNDPVIVSETTDEGQSSYGPPGLMKDLIKVFQSYSSPASSKVSAVKRTRFPARAKNNSTIAPRVSMWRYLRDRGEDMRKWHDQPTSALRARVKELLDIPTTSGVAPVITGNQ